jgi:hypothetical protein
MTRQLTRSLGCTAALLSWPGGQMFGQADMREFVFDSASSVLYVVTHKEGLLSFLGHEHAIMPMSWKGGLCLADSTAAGGSRGHLVVRTASLVIDSDSARTLASLGKGPGESTVRDLQRKMLDADHLDADSYPEIRLEVVALGNGTGAAGSVASGEGGLPNRAASGEQAQGEADASSGKTPEEGPAQQESPLPARATLSLHGVTRERVVPVTVEPLAEGGLRIAGIVTVRQSDFGIEPESIVGVVKVSDQVDLHFLLVAFPTGRTCEAGPMHADGPSKEEPVFDMGDGHGPAFPEGNGDGGQASDPNPGLSEDPGGGTPSRR